MRRLKAKNSDWTIVQDFSPIADYPLVALQPDIQRDIDTILTKETTDRQDQYRRVVRLFECYLQVTRQTLNTALLVSLHFAGIADGFMGAIESEKFMKATIMTRYTYRRLFRNLIVFLSKKYRTIQHIPEKPYSNKSLSLHTGTCIKLFRGMALDSERVWIWHGWRVENLDGQVRWLYLEPLASKFNRSFVDRVHQAAKDFFSATRWGEVLFISDIAAFTATYPGISQENLLDKNFANTFWKDFCIHYLENKIETTCPDGVIANWYSRIKAFAEQHLFVSGLYIEPEEFPTPPRRRAIGGTNHLGMDDTGAVRIEKLLTFVPIFLSQTDAIDILFSRLQRDVDLIIHWANCEAQKIWEAHQRRKNWENQGIPRRVLNKSITTGASWLTDRKNPDHLKNAAATIASYGGYITRENAPQIALLLPSGLAEVAQELGIPIAYSLLPHMAILVHEHPEITPAFLEKLTVFDEAGKFDGFIQEGTEHILKSIKLRRGPRTAEQHIVLTERAVEIVKQVMAITADPRNYLRIRKNDDWRHLFINTGKSFGIPKAVTKITESTSNPFTHDRRAEQIKTHTGTSFEEALDLVRRFTLPALRASIGVIKYVETSSGPKMAEYLGHRHYDPKLLSRYLPEPLRAFLQSRYVRIMQTGIIIEAMKDSPYLLEAASFTSKEELSAFLDNHSFKFPSNRPEPNYSETQSQPGSKTEQESIERVILNVDKNVLTLYASLELSMKKHPTFATPDATYWHNIGTRLMAYIEEKRHAEPLHMELLEYARQKADVRFVEVFFHA